MAFFSPKTLILNVAATLLAAGAFAQNIIDVASIQKSKKNFVDTSTVKKVIGADYDTLYKQGLKDLSVEIVKRKNIPDQLVVKMVRDVKQKNGYEAAVWVSKTVYADKSQNFNLDDAVTTHHIGAISGSQTNGNKVVSIYERKDTLAVLNESDLNVSLLQAYADTDGIHLFSSEKDFKDKSNAQPKDTNIVIPDKSYRDNAEKVRRVRNDLLNLFSHVGAMFTGNPVADKSTRNSVSDKPIGNTVPKDDNWPQSFGKLVKALIPAENSQTDAPKTTKPSVR